MAARGATSMRFVAAASVAGGAVCAMAGSEIAGKRQIMAATDQYRPRRERDRSQVGALTVVIIISCRAIRESPCATIQVPFHQKGAVVKAANLITQR
jgi:hypothetical protein